MLDIKQFLAAIKQIAEEKGIPEQSVFETVEAAIAAAYKRDYGKKGQIIKAKLDLETGDIKVTQTHYVVESVDEDGNITGQLPLKLMEEKPDFTEIEGRSRRQEKYHKKPSFPAIFSQEIFHVCGEGLTSKDY